jgi:NSS family neurotransmitter:Na+ symporter
VKREHWKSKLGFMWAATGSAVGLGSIWRFPYIVGENGGAIFILMFCFFLLFISLPIMLSEIVIGREGQSNPSDAFYLLGKTNRWKNLGTMQVFIGFLVSIFYSVICAWTLGYFIEALSGTITNFNTTAEAKTFWESCYKNISWTLGTLIGFIALSVGVLFAGVQKGIEATNKILMPLLFLFLLILAIFGLMMPGASKALTFMFSPNWSMINGKVAILALGQAFFALSVGQGTMVTYGSYLKKTDNIFNVTIPVTISIVVVSMLAGVAIFTAVFSLQETITSGPDLIFQTLPMVFSKMHFGALFAVIFFALILFAGLTSQISAMEPFIAYLTDHKSFSRHGAVIFCGILVLVFAIPVALSFGVLSSYKIFGASFFDALSFLCINILVPLGALAAVILVGWKNPFSKFIQHLGSGLNKGLKESRALSFVLSLSIRFLAPIVIFIIFLNLFYAA